MDRQGKDVPVLCIVGHLVHERVGWRSAGARQGTVHLDQPVLDLLPRQVRPVRREVAAYLVEQPRAPMGPVQAEAGGGEEEVGQRDRIEDVGVQDCSDSHPQ